VPLRQEDQEKTAVTTHFGIYHWLSMPFGLTNAPVPFQRALDIILSGFNWQLCLVYLDDVIIFFANAEQHVKDVDTVLHRSREAGVTLRASSPMAPTNQRPKRGTVWPFGRLERLGSAPKIGCDGAVTAQK